MEPLYWSKRLGMVMVMAYGAWMLYGNVSQLEHVLGANLDRHERSQPDKLGGENLEYQLIESNAFGKAALARMLECYRQYHGWTPFKRWDYICHIGGGIDGKTHQATTGEMIFGLDADSERITGMSDLYPAEGGIPASATSTAFSPNEPVREELTCGGRSFTAIYYPATKFFGPALNLMVRHIRGGQFRNSVEERAATDAAVRECIQSIERSKPIIQQLPATAWDVQNAGWRRFGLMPGAAEHLVFDPQTQQVLGWTKRDGLKPLQFPD